MNNRICLDQKKRISNLVFENKRYVLKSLYRNDKVIKCIKWNSSLKLSINKINNNRLVSRCIFSGKKKIFNNLFNISRLFFLKLYKDNYIFIMKK